MFSNVYSHRETEIFLNKSNKSLGHLIDSFALKSILVDLSNSVKY